MMHLCLTLTWVILIQFHIRHRIWDIQKVLKLLEVQVHRELLFMLVLMVLRDFQVLMVLRDFQVLMVLRDFQVLMVLRDFQVLMVLKVFLMEPHMRHIFHRELQPLVIRAQYH
jgi:hypothetical protein